MIQSKALDSGGINPFELMQCKIQNEQEDTLRQVIRGSNAPKCLGLSEAPLLLLTLVCPSLKLRLWWAGLITPLLTITLSAFPPLQCYLISVEAARLELFNNTPRHIAFSYFHD